ncbi:MAG: nucleotidyltransferase family protein [Muribaculaceae bacterium]|nr:nucleotidyltransferase family protein [Muribaculaceae bacterium]
MKRSISHSDLQLLALVRASLWQPPTEVSLFSKVTVDWQKIARHALQQTVGCLVFEAALSLPKALQPPKDWIKKALAFLESNRRTQIQVDRCAAEAIAKLQNEGLAPIILKGQAYARAYPRPDMRQCGDIDLYVGEESYQQAYSVAQRLEWESEEIFNPEAKHYGCRLNGIRIELHRIAGQLPSRSADRRFQQWSRNQLSSSKRVITIDGKDIPVPSPAFDIVFVFLHFYLHFLNGGIGLRHICDWTMLLHLHSKEIDINELERKLKDFRLMRGWKLFAPIAVEHLGLPESECPLYSKRDVSKSERILSTILREGNFGRARQSKTKRPAGYLAGKLFSFRRHSLNQIKKFRIDPNTISRTYCSYLIKGFTRVMKDLIKK